MMSIGLHNKALTSLRSAIVDSKQAVSPHTLLAAVLICCFEVDMAIHQILILYDAEPC